MLKVLLARHAQAEDSGGSKPDPERELVDKGREQAKLLGRVVEATAGVPAAVWSSPLRRALDTARIAMLAMNLKTDPKIVPDLGPEGDLDHLAWLVARGGADYLMLVGHQPDLGMLAARMLGISSEIVLRTGGLCLLETDDPTRPCARAIATLDARQYPAILEGREYAPWMRKQLRV